MAAKRTPKPAKSPEPQKEPDEEVTGIRTVDPGQKPEKPMRPVDPALGLDDSYTEKDLDEDE